MRPLFKSFFRKSPTLDVDVDHVLRKDSELQGRLIFSGGLSLEGKVQGDLVALGSKTAVVVGQHASLVTDLLKAETIVVHGHVQANRIEAKRIVLAATARVTGNIDAEAVEVHTGARFEGQVVTRGLQQPATEAASRPAEGSASMARSRLDSITDRSRPMVETA